MTRDDRALLIRHNEAIAQIRANPRMPEEDKLDLLMAVVWPREELLNASLQAAGPR